MPDRLPHPISRTDELLYDIATSLRQLTGRTETRPDGTVDLTEPDVDRYHTGGGWYQIPGHPKKVRRDDAEQILHG